MTNSQIEILKIALLNVEREELRLLDSLPYENYKFSDEHNAKIKKLIDKYDYSCKTMPKRLSIILVAAILAITLIMSISAIRIPVVNFFVEIYEGFISIFVDESDTGDTNKIQEIYMPQYIPEQYKQSTSFLDDYTALSYWENGNSKITINQNILNVSQSFIDYKNSDYIEYMIGSQKIYYMIASTLYAFVTAYSEGCPFFLVFTQKSFN